MKNKIYQLHCFINRQYMCTLYVDSYSRSWVHFKVQFLYADRCTVRVNFRKFFYLCDSKQNSLILFHPNYCQKFAAVCQRIATSCPQLFNSWATTPLVQHTIYTRNLRCHRVCVAGGDRVDTARFRDTPARYYCLSNHSNALHSSIGQNIQEAQLPQRNSASAVHV